MVKKFKPPSLKELTATGFSHPKIPRISAEQLRMMMGKGDDFVLVDVREEGPFSQHIKGSRFIPVQYSSGAPILTKIVMLDLRFLPKDKLIIFYDSGDKDKVAASMAQVLIDLKEGYDPANIKVLWRGFDRWMELDYPYYDTFREMPQLEELLEE